MKVVRSFALLLCLIALSAAVFAAPLSPYRLTEEEKARLDKWEQDLDRQADELIRQKRWEFFYVGYERSSGTPGAACDLPPKGVQLATIDVRWRPARPRVDAAAERFNKRIVLAMRAAGDDSCALNDALVIGNVLRETLAGTAANCPLEPQQDISAAARDGCAAEVKRLIASGAKIDWRDTYNLDGLSWAIIRGDLNITRMLFSAGALANRRPRERDIPPLALAAQFKRSEIMKELLRRGAEVDAEWRILAGPSNALDYAALSGDVATMRLLVDAGAPIEAQGNDSQGPLVHAAWSGRVAAVQYLLDEGADPKRRIFEPLIPTTHSALHGAIGSGSADVVRLLLKAGVDPNLDADDLGNTPLHFASWWKSNYDVVKALIDAGAKVDAIDRLKRTPLNSVLGTWQWQSDQTRIVKLLLSKGADPNRLNNHGVSPLMLAAVKCPPTSELIQTLLDAGADKGLRDAQGKTALDRFKAKKDCPTDSRATDATLSAIETLLTPR